MTSTPRFLMLAAALLAAGSAASAQDAPALRARSLAATCAQCHGTDGHTPPGSAMRALAGMPAPYLVEQMLAFRSGERPGSVMPQLAKGYSEAQIAQLAAYFANPVAAAKPCGRRAVKGHAGAASGPLPNARVRSTKVHRLGPRCHAATC